MIKWLQNIKEQIRASEIFSNNASGGAKAAEAKETELYRMDGKGRWRGQVRKPSSVESVPSLIVASYAYLLFAGTEERALPGQKWYPAKTGQRHTTQDMISLFRTQLWEIGLEEKNRLRLK